MEDREQETAPGREAAGRLVSSSEAARLDAASIDWPSWSLTAEQALEFELLVVGGCAPLDGYLCRADLEGVVRASTLADGTPWGMPVTLVVPPSLARSLGTGAHLALRDAEGVMLGAVEVSEVWQGDRGWHVAGPVTGLRLSQHLDFPDLRLTPDRARTEMRSRGYEAVIGYEPGRFLTWGQREGLRRLAGALDAGVFLAIGVHPGLTDTQVHFARVRALRLALRSEPRMVPALLPVPERGLEGPAGVWKRVHLARNYGCTHVALDVSDLANLPGGPEAFLRWARTLGIEVVELPAVGPGAERGTSLDVAAAMGPPSETARTEDTISTALEDGVELPGSVATPAEIDEWRLVSPPRHRRGFTVFLTGLSGSGKSTIARVLQTRLLATTRREVTLLDGDIVRKNLSSELGFSKEHREANILRIGFVAGEITRHHGIAICCPIAPYDATRKRVRGMISPHGGFVLVHVATSLDVCERRDRKGLYAKARAGLIPQFTGVSDPYEQPADAEIVIDTERTTAAQAAEDIVAYLRSARYLVETTPEERNAAGAREAQ